MPGSSCDVARTARIMPALLCVIRSDAVRHAKAGPRPLYTRYRCRRRYCQPEFCCVYSHTPEFAAGDKFSVWHVQSAVVAGAASMAMAGPMLANPWGALVAGAVAGALCSWVRSTAPQPAPIVSRSDAALSQPAGTGCSAAAARASRCFRRPEVSEVVSAHLLPGLIGGVAAAIAAARVSVAFSYTTANINAVVLGGRDSRVQVCE